MSTDDEYTPALNEIVKQVRGFGLLTTPEQEVQNDATYAHALAMAHPLPVGYIVKAVLKCNQINTFTMSACEYRKVIETRKERVTALCRRALEAHLVDAHPYLDAMQRRVLRERISFNFRDVGR